jgi:hypothetical protein
MMPRQELAGEYDRVRVGPFATEQEVEHVARGLKCGGHRMFLDEVPETALPAETPKPPRGPK